MPRVSIILPTHNGERFIQNAIASVQSQSFFDWELIVVDDGSTELGVGEIVKKFSEKDSRIIYLRNEQNLGIQKSLNKGWREAKGEYLARIDDDDEWCDKDKLKKQVEFLDKNSDYVLVGTGVVVIDDSDKKLFQYLNPETDEKIRRQILGKNCFTHSSILIRKTALDEVGGYSENAAALHVEDYDLFLRLGLIGKMANLSFAGVKWRLRRDSLSSKNRMTQFKNGLGLVLKHRNSYPGFFKGYLRSWLRLVAYGLFRFIPLLELKYFIFRVGRQR